MCIDCPDLLILLNEFAHASIQTALYIFYSIIISQLRVRNISGIKNLYPKNLYTLAVKSVEIRNFLTSLQKVRLKCLQLIR